MSTEIQINFSSLILEKNICWICPAIDTLVPYFVRVNYFEPQGLLKLFSFNKCLYTKPFEWKFYRRVKSNSFNWLLLNKFDGLWHDLNKLFFFGSRAAIQFSPLWNWNHKHYLSSTKLDHNLGITNSTWVQFRSHHGIIAHHFFVCTPEIIK